VNECGEPLVEPTSKTGYHSEVVGLESRAGLDIADNPDTAGKPRSINHFLCFIKCLSHKSYECYVQVLGVE
jgi:hypothetical protein